MEIYYNIESNRHSPIIMEKLNTGAIYKRHGKHGFVILSANRSDKSKEENIKNTKKLITDIQEKYYRYLPVYGGYKGTDGVEDEYEPSFIVFPYNNKEKQWTDFNELKSFALQKCKDYDQDSIFVMEPDLAPNYLDRNGKKVNVNSSKELKVNDLTQSAFTSFKPKEEVDKEMENKLLSLYRNFYKNQKIKGTFEEFKKKHPLEEFKKEHLKDIKSVGRKSSSDIQWEWLANPYPCTILERMRRQEKGEIIYEKNIDLI